MGCPSYDEIIAELAKIKRGWKGEIYFLEKYALISHPIKGLLPFKLYKFQKEIIRDFHKYRYNIHNKTRQVGDTTITAGHVAYFAMFNNDKEIQIASNKMRNAARFLRKVKRIILSTPEWLRPSIITNNRNSLELSNGTWIDAVATTEDAGRSDALSLLVVDEAAQIRSELADNMWEAAGPTLAHGGSAIILSSPRGVGNFFHKTCINAINATNVFHYRVIHWTDHPVFNRNKYRRDDGEWSSPWYEEECSRLNNNPRSIAQELDCEFLSSGYNVLNAEALRIQEPHIKAPIHTMGIDSGLWIWKEPEPQLRYFIGADVARGDGEDYSTAHVISLTVPMEQVAEYHGKLPPDMFANLLYTLGVTYNKALMIPECNGVGYAVAMKLVEKKYPKIHYSESYKNLHKQFTNMYNPATKIPGFQTSTATRPLLISQLEQDVRSGDFIMHSQRLFTEFDTFHYINGKPMAIPGYNDDLIIACGIALFIRATCIRAIVNSRDMTKMMIGSISHTTGQQIGLTLMPSRTTNQYSSTFRMSDGTDLSWLVDK